MRQQDNAEWILRTVRRILRDIGPKAARQFIERRGGSAKWQAAAREIARHSLREQGSSVPGTIFWFPSLSGRSVMHGLSVEISSLQTRQWFIQPESQDWVRDA